MLFVFIYTWTEQQMELLASGGGVWFFVGCGRGLQIWIYLIFQIAASLFFGSFIQNDDIPLNKPCADSLVRL